MHKIQVVNIKCGGCANSIASGLEKEGMKNISVDVGSQTVLFEGDCEKAKNLLSKMGYPQAGSKEAKSLGRKAKSFVSCAIGRVKSAK